MVMRQVYLRSGCEEWVWVIPKEYFEQVGTIDFYGMTVNIPSQVEDFLTRHYGNGIETPEESLFYVTEKVASEVVDEMINLQNGETTSKTKLTLNKEAVDGFFTDYYGEVPYKSPDEMSHVIASLPKNDAEAFTKVTGLVY